MPRKYSAFTRRDLERLPLFAENFTGDQLEAMKAVSAVLPFRVNSYVVDQLIDWSDVPNDPIFQLTFPQPGMLPTLDFNRMLDLVTRGADDDEIKSAARDVQWKLNPHPAGQMQLNVPSRQGSKIDGMQHKYRETVLFFPSQGQTCHAYCTYCFRWAQFVGIDELKFANREVESLLEYIDEHPSVSSVLFTGGDPLIMRTKILRRYIEPLLDHPQIHSIRLGTKAPAYWPYRFVTDSDADDLMRLFELVRQRGKHLALMAHFSHPRELSTPIAERALRRIQDTGAVVRTQAPLIRHVNDSAETWAEMWQRQVQLGVVPYYMFVERDTGPKRYFEVPLARAFEIFQSAYRRQSGLGRTVRGPSMSANPGKIVVDGVVEIHGEKMFALSMLQGREPEWTGIPFFAKYDETATWIDDLEPALGESEFFFEREMTRLERSDLLPRWRARSSVPRSRRRAERAPLAPAPNAEQNAKSRRESPAPATSSVQGMRQFE